MVTFDFIVKNIKSIESIIVKINNEEIEFNFLQYLDGCIVASKTFFDDIHYWIFPNGKLVRKHDNGKEEKLTYELVDATV